MGNKVSAALRVIKIGADSTDEHNGSGGGGVRPIENDRGVPQYPPAYPPYSPVSPQYPSEYSMSSPVFDAILPRPLNSGDKVTIKGKVSNNPSEFTVILGTGAYNIDYNNIALQYRADFAKERVTLSYTKDGKLEETGEENLLFSAGGNWELRLEMNNSEIIVIIDGSYHAEISLEHSLEKIRFLQVTGHIDSVKTLDFEFA